MDVTAVVLPAVGAVLLLAVTVKIFAAPLKLLFRVCVNALLGLGALVLLDAAGAVTGLSVGLNLFNALVVGILGVPGLGLLLLTQWIFT